MASSLATGLSVELESRSRHGDVGVELLACWTDQVFDLLGPNTRFALDPLLGLLSGASDPPCRLRLPIILSAAHQGGVSQATVLRMAVRVAVDLIFGVMQVPGHLDDASTYTPILDLNGWSYKHQRPLTVFSRPPGARMRLGVFLPNWIGDVVMATPALRALRKLAGDGPLVGIMRPYVAEVLDGSDWFDQTIIYVKGRPKPTADGKQSDAAASHRWPAVRKQLRAAKLEKVVLLTNSLRTAWMAYRSGAAERVGMAGNLRGPLLTTRVYAPVCRGRRMILPALGGYLHLSQAAGAAPEPPTLELATTPADELAADAVWRRHGYSRAARVAVLNTGGAFGAAKDWPAHSFAQLARRLADDRDMHVLFNCGPAERQAVSEIVARLNHPRVNSLAQEAQLPIGLTKAAIRRASLLVTTDSGPRFFGVAFGVPTVSIFGPTDAGLTLTGASSDLCVSLRLECQPCMARTCPVGHHRCMRDLSVEQVLAAVDGALNSTADLSQFAA